MKTCFDTSVLVAALLKHHPGHAAAFPRLKAIHNGSARGVITTHILAELFEVLTSLPLNPKLDSQDVRQLIRTNILNHFEIVTDSAASFALAMNLTASRGLAGSAIHDALCLAGARRAECEKLLTFNLKHFRSLAPQDPMVVCP